MTVPLGDLLPLEKMRLSAQVSIWESDVGVTLFKKATYVANKYPLRSGTMTIEPQCLVVLYNLL